MKKRFIKIQKIKFEGDESPYVGHLYYIKFDAWTFSKQDLWASLMFRIFQALNEQMEIEAKLTSVTLSEGRLSVIELFDKLKKVWEEYFQSLEEKGVEKIEAELRRVTQTDRICESFSNIFASQRKEDDNDLKKAEEALKQKSSRIVQLGIICGRTESKFRILFFS